MRNKALTIAFLSLIGVVLFYSGCKKKQDVSGKPESLKYLQMFSNTSPFFQKIDPNSTIDPNSPGMIQNLVAEANKGFVVAVKEWSVAVYYADASTSRHDVKMTASWAPKNKLTNVPIPDFAEPDPSADGSMVVIDELSGCVYDFWEMRYTSSGWKAGWGNAIPLSSNGIFPKGLSARGSGFELLQGLIWPQELVNGKIEHALSFSYDFTRAGGPVPPATESDGTTNSDDGIPEGARVQLNPALDLSTLNLNNYEMTIAVALQEYGMFCVDDGGGLSLYAVNPISCTSNPYAQIWGDQALVDLSKIPASEFRVLNLPPQYYQDPEIVTNGCNYFD